MKQQIKHELFKLFHTHKPRQKHTYISIEKDGTVSLRSPIKDINILLNIINEREEWILSQLKKYALVYRPKLGEELLYLGEVHSLQDPLVSELKAKVNRVKLKTPERLEKCYSEFYKNVSQAYIPSRVALFSNIMKVYPNTISFRKMKRRWGSCDSQKNLVFNSKIMKLKPSLIDYIVVHELAHIKHMNHSKSFNDFVALHLEDARIREQELRYVSPQV